MEKAASYEQDFLTKIEKYYRWARRDVAKETQKSLQTFLTECPYMIAQILDPEFLF
ncbi:MAG: hypothetical protein RLZZ139_3992 [Cyanobacteriota bacterium]